MTITCAGTFLLMLNNQLWESADLAPTSTASWTQEPFPTGGPQGITVLGTVGGTAWVLDSVVPAPLWLRIDKNTYVQLKATNLPDTPLITSDLSPDRIDFYTTPFLFPPFIQFAGGSNIVGNIGVPGGQTQQMYALSSNGGQTAQLFSFGNLPFPTIGSSKSKLMRFWGDERGTYPFSGGPLPFFMAQVRQPSPPPPATPDFLYGGASPSQWTTTPVLMTGTSVGGGASVQQIADDFIRKQNGTFLANVILTTGGSHSLVRSTDGVSWGVASVPSAALLQPGLVECDNGTVLVPTPQPSPGFVLRSTDDGQSFQSTLAIPGVTLASSVFLKYFPGLDVLFALVNKLAGSAPFGGAVYMSNDQGQTWAQVFTSSSGGASPVQVTSWMAVTGQTRSSVKQLLGQNSGCTIFSPQTAPIIATVPPSPGSTSAPYLGQFFFYSNNPEPASQGLVDNNLWLLRETVAGSGRVFLWHGNDFSNKLSSELLIYNPNSFSITVNASGGAVPLSGNGVDAWFALFNGTGAAGTPLTISKNSFGTLFVQTGLPKGNPFGVVADVSITDSNRRPAQATLLDVAWTKNFNPATLNSSGQQAPKDGSSRVRGLAAASSPPNNYGYWIPVILNNFSIASILAGSTQGFTVAGANPAYFPKMTPDAFNGADAPFITDPDGSIAPLVGDYGAQLCITWPIANDDPMGVSHTVTFYAGSSQNLGSPTNFAFLYAAPGGCSGSFSGLNTNQYLALLQDTIPPRTTVTYKFQIVTIGAFTYPLTLWVGVT